MLNVIPAKAKGSWWGLSPLLPDRTSPWELDLLFLLTYLGDYASSQVEVPDMLLLGHRDP